MAVTYTTENKPIEYKTPLELEREADTASLYANQAGSPQFAADLSGKRVSSLSSTDGAKTVADIKTAIAPPPPVIDPKTGLPVLPPPVSATDKLTEQTLQAEIDAGKTEAQRQADDATALWNKLVPTQDLSSQKANQINSIKNTYAAARSLLDESNRRFEKTIETAGIRSGTSRYAPEISAGIMASEERASAMRIAELNAREQSAINDIEKAFSDKEYTLGLQKYQVLQGIQDTKNKEIKDAQEKANERLKKLQEKNRLSNIEDVVSDSVMLGNLDKNTLYRTLRIAGFNATTKEVDDAFNNILPKSVSSSDVSADERIFAQMKADGTLPKEATMFDYWKKKDEAMRDPKSQDPLLATIRALTIQEKSDKMSNYITFQPKDQKEFDYADAFRGAVSDGTIGDQQFRGRTFSKFMEEGNFSRAREFIFQTAIETSLADTQKTIGGAADTLKALSGFRGLMREMVEAGVPTNIVTGTAEDIVRKLGETTNKKYVDFKARISKILFDYRKAMTGVQFSFAEGEQYQKLFPDYKNNISINSQLIESMSSSLTMQVDNFYERKLGSQLYNTLASEGVAEAYGVLPQDSTGDVEGMRSQLQEGEILIKRNGQVGAISKDEFDPTTDTKI